MAVITSVFLPISIAQTAVANGSTWADLNNGLTFNYTDATTTTGSAGSNTIELSYNFGAIGAGDTINGITVTARLGTQGTNTPAVFRLLKNGVVVGSKTLNATGGYQTTQGSTSDNWASGLTGADFASGSVTVQFQFLGPGLYCGFDYANITVTRTEGVAATPDTFVTITTTGAGSTTFPTGMDTANVEVWSGGQGGWIEGGGHGGNFVQSTLTGAPGSTINYMVGAGGAGSVYSQNNGGDSWVGTSTTILAKGGGNRTGNIGTVSYYGGLKDTSAYAITNYPGGGGGSAHPLGNGGNAATYSGSGTGFHGGASGSTAGGAGAGESNVEGGAGGGGGGGGTNPGGSPGGGGGGSGQNGGAGGRGQIRFTFTASGTSAPTRKAPRGSNIQ